MWILKHDLLSPAFLPQISNFLCIITWNERITTGVGKKSYRRLFDYPSRKQIQFMDELCTENYI